MAEQQPHKLSLENRNRLTMTGVEEVLSFDEDSVMLKTGMGLLAVHGQQLQLRQLSREGGQVAVEGEISALIYEPKRAAGGWLSRLLG